MKRILVGWLCIGLLGLVFVASYVIGGDEGPMWVVGGIVGLFVLILLTFVADDIGALLGVGDE